MKVYELTKFDGVKENMPTYFSNQEKAIGYAEAEIICQGIGQRLLWIHTHGNNFLAYAGENVTYFLYEHEVL